MQTKIVKLLMSKTKVAGCTEAFEFCLGLWDDLSLALIDSCGSNVVLPGKKELSVMQEKQVVLRLALLADFYRYQREDLDLNREESGEKLRAVRAKAFTLLARATRSTALGGYGLHEPVATGAAKDAVPNNSKHAKEGLERTIVGNERDAKNERLRSRAACQRDESMRWSDLGFSTPRTSYHMKLVRAFQAVKNVGHSMLTLNSEWGLSCYYKIATAYTTNQPLEMAAACLPELRQAVDLIHGEQFQKLSELKVEVQTLLYAVLNCHINWVDHNHKQILLVPGPPGDAPPREEGDLRCSRCLKNQTFHSSEVRGNPRNIDVEFDFEQMKFGSSCCAAPMINVPLSTRAVNTCTFTEMKQMYTSCLTCKQPIFSEVLVDVEMLHSRCTVCTRQDA